MVVLSGAFGDQGRPLLTQITTTAEQRYKGITTAHHEWINKVDDPQYLEALNRIRYSQQILNKIQETFPDQHVYNVPEADEIYWAVSPKDANGSDRALVDCHYDAPFAFLPTGGVTYYRVIIATNENNDVTTVFPHANNTRVKMSTGDFHGLDYNKDWHCVEGQIPPGKYRVLLKLHYLAVPSGSEHWVSYVRDINVWWTAVSRKMMRMSANPENWLEYVVAMIVNVARVIFNNIYAFTGIVAVLVGVYVIVSGKQPSTRRGRK
jgi:hypothetical protein